MKTIAGLLGFVNMVWVPIIFFILLAHKFGGEFYMGLIFLITCVPFCLIGIKTLKNINNPDLDWSQNIAIWISVLLFIPFASLVLCYKLGGLIVSLILCGFLCYGVLVKKPYHKLVFINSIGLFFLVLHLLIIAALQMMSHYHPG